jgi:hypothetical protein
MRPYVLYMERDKEISQRRSSLSGSLAGWRGAHTHARSPSLMLGNLSIIHMMASAGKKRCREKSG